ncbi:MAG: tetratricopeptide repeat protein [Bacteroidales bacterium]|nr:tetratricopeptide repeat protein [Bacteroidales bacterium]
MRINYIIILILFFSSFSAIAQETINYPAIDKKTYEQYLSKDWKALIKTGKQSLKNNINFYYLQVRMGIAYYELKRYPKAVKYFENAFTQNKNDELIQEYLYFSYVFSGRYEDARVLTGKFKRQLKEKLNISAEHPFISAFYLETKHDISDDYKYIPQIFETVSQKVVSDQSYYNASLEHLIGGKISIFHGYSNVGIKNLITDDDIDLPPVYEENIAQNEYYFSLKAQIAKGTSLSGGFHFLHTKYNASDPNPVSAGRWGSTSYTLYKFSENSFVASLNLSKQFSILKITAGASVANLNLNFQFQPELSLRLYPFGNLKIYSDSKFAYLIENAGSIQNLNPIFKQSIGINFLKYSWFEPAVTIGNMVNYTSYNAFIVNNDVDIIKQKYEALLNFGLAKGRFNLFFKYQYNIKENTFEINGVDNQKEYVNQSITGGIKWYFKKY